MLYGTFYVSCPLHTKSLNKIPVITDKEIGSRDTLSLGHDSQESLVDQTNEDTGGILYAWLIQLVSLTWGLE